MKKVLSVILTVCFILPLLITHAVYAEENEAQTFVDVPESAWYCDSVKYVSENGLMKGTSEATFSPDMTLSRAMVVTILYRMAGEPDVESADGGEMKFTDVKPHEWYTDAVLWAYNLGIVNGVEANTYAPDRDVTRAELATMLFRYVQKFTLSLPYDPTYPAYADADSIPEYAEHGVIILSRAGVINGKDGNRFDPKASATRAEAAALFSRFAEKATVQDFSLIESLGVSISVGVYIEREWILLGGDIFKTIEKTPEGKERKILVIKDYDNSTEYIHSIGPIKDFKSDLIHEEKTHGIDNIKLLQLILKLDHREEDNKKAA